MESKIKLNFAAYGNILPN